jgi:hypothetical protein
VRTVTFQSVFQGVLRRHGLDPTGDAITMDTGEAIAEKISRRAGYGLKQWDFQEFSHTEERAFRSIWNNTRQFLRVGDNGAPDEFFYIGTPIIQLSDQGYYKVKSTAPSDPPVGTLPTNTTYFDPLTPVDTFIELDQTCRRTIGQVLGIYRANPRLAGCGFCGLPFRPSEKGIDVYGGPGPTVFVHYMLPPPKFTIFPYIPGKTNEAGERVFFPETGECYRALGPTVNQDPTNQNFWAIEPMLEALAAFVEAGAYADCLRETFREGDEQVRLARAQLAESEAAAYLETEIDALQAQGQTYYYNLFWSPWWRRGVCVSQPWSGSTVTTLSDVCEQDYVVPPTPTRSQVVWEFHPEISSLLGSPHTLEGLATRNWLPGSLVELVITLSGVRSRQTWQLVTGPSDASDPGQVRPADYDSLNNDKHWVQVT